LQDGFEVNIFKIKTNKTTGLRDQGRDKDHQVSQVKYDYFIQLILNYSNRSEPQNITDAGLRPTFYNWEGTHE